MTANTLPIEEVTGPRFQIAVRDNTGKPHQFTLQHPDIQTYQQAMQLTHDEFPKATVLCSVPVIKAA